MIRKIIVSAFVVIVVISGILLLRETLKQQSTHNPPSQSKNEKSLTLETIKNMEYYHSYCKVPMKLTDGVFYWTENFQCEQETPLGFLFRIYNEKIALGDLNLDGKDDAAVVLTTNYGGTGDFRELAIVINQNGTFKHVASAELGDRVVVNMISIQDSRIVLDMVVHGPVDGACCPTQEVRSVFQFDAQQQKLIKLQ